MNVSQFIPRSETHYPGRTSAVIEICNKPRKVYQPVPEILYSSLKDIKDEIVKNKCNVDAVTITGIEPLSLPETLELITFFSIRGFHVKIDTDSTCNDLLESVIDMVECVGIYLDHRPWVGDRFFDTLRIAINNKKHYDVRTVYHNGLSFSELDRISHELPIETNWVILKAQETKDHTPQDVDLESLTILANIFTKREIITTLIGFDQ